MGVAFSIGGHHSREGANVTALCGSQLLLVAHIFAFNDWAESYDQKNSNNGTAQAGAEAVNPRKLLLFSLFLLLASLLVFAFPAKRNPCVLAIIIAGVGIFTHTRI